MEVCRFAVSKSMGNTYLCDIVKNKKWSVSYHDAMDLKEHLNTLFPSTEEDQEKDTPRFEIQEIETLKYFVDNSTGYRKWVYDLNFRDIVKYLLRIANEKHSLYAGNIFGQYHVSNNDGTWEMYVNDSTILEVIDYLINLIEKDPEPQAQPDEDPNEWVFRMRPGDVFYTIHGTEIGAQKFRGYISGKIHDDNETWVHIHYDADLHGGTGVVEPACAYPDYETAYKKVVDSIELKE